MIPRRFALLLAVPCALLFLLALISYSRAEITADAVVSTCTEADFDVALGIANVPGGGTITFACSGTIAFAAQKVVTYAVTIDGAGQNVVLSGNSVTRHFAIAENQGALHLRNLTLSDGAGRESPSSANAHGGSISVRANAVLTLTNVTLHHNVASGRYGGAIHNNAGNVTVVDSTLHDNTAETGGAILNDTQARLVITGSTFFSNTSQGTYAGAILNRGALTATATSFVNNSTMRFGVPGEGGGALFNQWDATAQLRKVDMEANFSAVDGGAILNNGALGIEESLFHSNTTNLAGGAIYHHSTDSLTIARTRFAQNRANSGTALFAGSPLTVTDSDFNQNGGVTSSGGAIVIDYVRSPIVLERITLRNNTGALGAGLTANGSDVTVRNSTLSGNHAGGRGGALASMYGTLALINVTIVSNTAPNTGASGLLYAVSAETDPPPSIVNSVIAGNTPSDCRFVHGSQGDIFFPAVPASYSIAGDDSCGLTGSGVLTNTSPQLEPLADNGGYGLTHYPVVNGPAHDGGTNTGCPAIDQRGATRPFGAACDVGAVEYYPPPSPTATPTHTHTPVPSSTPTHTHTPVPSSTPTNTYTPVPSSTPAHTKIPTPTYTNTPIRTPEPEDAHVFLPGVRR